MASFTRYLDRNFFLKFRKYPLDVLNRNCYTHLKFRRSSAVEQLTVNQLVVGSIPTAGANKNRGLANSAASFFVFQYIWGSTGGPKFMVFYAVY